MQHQPIIDQISEGFSFVDNRDGLYRRITTSDGRTLAYIYPRVSGNRYYNCEHWGCRPYRCRLKVVWASPIADAPGREFYPDITTDRNDREWFLTTATEENAERIRAMLQWAQANPAPRAGRNRPRGPRVGLERRAASGRRVVLPAAHRRIGIEVEFFGLNRRDAERIVRECDVDRQGWSVRADGSVTRWQGNIGLELVSPVLGGDPENPPYSHVPVEAGMTVLSAILSAYRAAGARVDRTCGVHVHMEAKDVGPSGVKRFVELWANNQEHIDLMLPNSRRDQNGGYVKRYREYDLQRLQNARNLWRDDRYYVVNVSAYHKFGTVEVRQHSGTLQFSKIRHWINFTLGMMHIVASAPSRGDGKVEALRKRGSLVELMRNAPMPDETREFYEERAVDFGATHGQLYGDNRSAILVEAA